MARRSMIEAVREQTGCTHAQAREAMAAMLKLIARDLKTKGRFVLTGFGTFTVSRMKARKGRNPRTGEEIKIKSSKTVRFRASRNLRGVI